MPTTTRTAPSCSLRRAFSRRSPVRTDEANLGSSSTRARSICSSRRCSCSESGTSTSRWAEPRPSVAPPTVPPRIRALRKRAKGDRRGEPPGTRARSLVRVARRTASPAPDRARPGLRGRRAAPAGRPLAVQQGRRPHRAGAEPAGRPVGGQLGVPPAVLPGAELELLRRGARPRPAARPAPRPAGSGPGPARARRTGPGRCRRAPARRRWGRRGCGCG